MKFLISILVVLALLIITYKLVYPTYSWHQKMTVEVEVDGKLYSGSSVVAPSAIAQPRLLPRIGPIFNTRGEAVVLRLPDGKYLFALLKGIGPIHTSRVFRDRLGGAMGQNGLRWAKILSRLREKRDLTPALYPLLVTFKDINDPASVQKVTPDDLAATFGPGYALKSITLKITDELVTTGKVEEVLGWLEGVGRRQANLKGKPPSGLVSEQPDPYQALLTW